MREGWSPARTNLICRPNIQTPFPQSTLTYGVIFVKDGHNDRSRWTCKVERIALPVRRYREHSVGKAQVRPEGFEEVGLIKRIPYVVLQVFDIDTPELDPSPAPGGDNQRITWED
jgi:hypothetical protein